MSNSTTTTCSTAFPCTAAPHPRTTAAGGGWLGFLARMVEAVETRRMLAGLDDRMLADIGLSRADALREAGRRPWDVAPEVGHGPRRRA